MRKTIIALAGPKRVGKSSVAEEIKYQYTDTTILSFAQPVRDMLSAIGIEEPPYEEKETKLFFGDKTYRDLMISLGTSWGRDLVAYNIWAQIGMARAMKAETSLVVFDDCRFENESDLVRGSVDSERQSNGCVYELCQPNVEYEGGPTETRISSNPRRPITQIDVVRYRAFSPGGAAQEILMISGLIKLNCLSKFER